MPKPTLDDVAALVTTIKNARAEATETSLDVAGINYQMDILAGKIADLAQTRDRMLAHHEQIRIECKVTENALVGLINDMTEPGDDE